MGSNSEESSRLPGNNGAHHNALRTVRQGYTSTSKYDASTKTSVEYDAINTDGNELTGNCV
jgi:hypothetical protein